MPIIDEKKAKEVQDSFNSFNSSSYPEAKPRMDEEPRKKPVQKVAEYSMEAISRRLGL